EPGPLLLLAQDQLRPHLLCDAQVGGERDGLPLVGRPVLDLAVPLLGELPLPLRPLRVLGDPPAVQPVLHGRLPEQPLGVLRLLLRRVRHRRSPVRDRLLTTGLTKEWSQPVVARPSMTRRSRWTPSAGRRES